MKVLSVCRVAIPLAVALLVTTSCGSDSDLDPTEPLAVGLAVGSPKPDAGAMDVTQPSGDATQTQGEMMQWSEPPAMQLEPGTDYRARITTNKGVIVVDLFEDEAPLTVNNFVFLAQEGFYTNVPFHRVMSGFMIQTGDPTGTGAGGPGYRFNDEPVVRDYEAGTLAMANAGPDTNGSQFFITHVNLTGRLQKAYTIFGTVEEGMDAVNAIAATPVGPSASTEMSSPLEPVFIESIEIFTM